MAHMVNSFEDSSEQATRTLIRVLNGAKGEKLVANRFIYLK
jgi:hypothetical protein